MAKKKRRKKKRQLNKQVKFELLGLLFIFLAIFGSGASAISDGAIPGGLEHIFRFFWESGISLPHCFCLLQVLF
ncbi:hypothetical protein [Lentibacillus sp. CBA3610]|uniref:hypothetical protein n=1 Tax=Lentibacillus sp. CBA3610 TaxID=2518176 RepID=UPI0015958A97|nr:hypothetical protein [Lentibacillus sp. CBA3610]QKY69075.1 hypothetical protein Len3610_05160 [Lentibacillus sp. CBA3610]